tara:strand:+ start:2252 stop:2686 length:435 start_codon:yes stop_codon:yes gene_type:complete
MAKSLVEQFKELTESEEGKKAFSKFIESSVKSKEIKDPKEIKEPTSSKKDNSNEELMKMVKELVDEGIKNSLKTLKEDNVKKEENNEELDLLKLLKENQELERNKNLNKKEEEKKQEQDINDRMARMAKIDVKSFNKEESKGAE